MSKQIKSIGDYLNIIGTECYFRGQSSSEYDVVSSSARYLKGIQKSQGSKWSI